LKNKHRSMYNLFGYIDSIYYLYDITLISLA
jgi:hypothetical protein